MVIGREMDGSSSVGVYGYVRDKEKIPPKRSLLCSTTAFSKEVAQQNAAKQDLEVLRTKYNIREDRSMPN